MPNYTNEHKTVIWNYVCDEISGGNTLPKIVKETRALIKEKEMIKLGGQEIRQFPSTVTLHKWRLDDELNRKYTIARMSQADHFVDECIEIADNATSKTWMVDRLRIDTRKWIACKQHPKAYGDKQEIMIDEQNRTTVKKGLDIIREARKDYEATLPPAVD